MALKCYYAHTMASYNSTIEEQDIELLENLGFEVINPNSPQYKEGCQAYIENNGKENVMNYFKTIIASECDMIAFRAFPNGQIPSGIAAELEYALFLDYPILELPCSLNKRMMNYPETKEFLIELGHYKV